MGLNATRLKDNILPKESARDHLLFKDSARIKFNLNDTPPTANPQILLEPYSSNIKPFRENDNFMKFMDFQEIQEELSSNDISQLGDLQINPYDIKINSFVEGKKPIPKTIKDLGLNKNMKEANIILNNIRDNKEECLFETVIDDFPKEKQKNHLENEITNLQKEMKVRLFITYNNQ